MIVAVAAFALLSSRDVDVLAAALIARLDAGLQLSVGSQPLPTLSRICAGYLDGSDLPEAVIERARAKIQIYPLSRCPKDMRGSDLELRLSKPRIKGRGRAEVEWKGLGNVGVLVICKRHGHWEMCGTVGGMVSDRHLVSDHEMIERKGLRISPDG